MEDICSKVGSNKAVMKSNFKTKDIVGDIPQNSGLRAYADSLLEGFANAVIIWDTNMTVFAINQQWITTFNLSEDKVLGLKPNELDKLILKSIAEKDFIKVTLKKARSTPNIHPPIRLHVLPINSTEESYLELKVLHIENGPFAGFLIEEYRCMNQQAKLEQQFHTIQKKLIQSQKLETAGVVASGAFHDLNNILSIISGYAQMIEILPDNRVEYIKKIDESCSIMSRIIKQNIQFATSNIGCFERTNLNPIVDNALTLIRHSIPKRIKVECDLDEQLPSVKLNQIQIFQMIMNLCLNASHAIEDKGKIYVRTFSKEISQEQDKLSVGKYVCMEVRDTGCGMGDHTSNKLFVPFFSKKLVTGKGHGLGLFVVSQIIEQHDAVILVESELQVGTSITVYFTVP